jgi:archaemetzincin
MKKFMFLVFFFTTLVSCDHADVQQPQIIHVVEKPVINLVALGDVPTSDIQFVKKELEDFYNVNVVLRKQLPMIDELRVNGTGKYQANNILNFLNENFKNVEGKVLAITKKDICTDRSLNGVIRKNWGIYGLGSLGGKTCVVSTYRFNKKYHQKLSKVSIHEIGHTLGIPHCNTNSNCLMNDAKGKGSNVDSTNKWMCSECRKKIRWDEHKPILTMGMGNLK